MKKVCNATKVAFQGETGAFSESAAYEVFKDTKYRNIEPIGLHTFQHVFTAVETGDCEFGILPIENSISGTLHVVYDLLIRSSLHIVGECTSIEDHCLCILPGTVATEITQVMSHPVILDQCDRYLSSLEERSQHTIKRVSTWDSSGACATLKQQQMVHGAAIASRRAAAFHQLEIVENGIGNELNNETRYIIIAKPEMALLHNTRPLKRSIAIAAPNESGALFKIVAAFALRDMPILKIESRPASTASMNVISRHWDYVFYLDYEPSTKALTNQRLLETLEEHSLWIREMGCYSQNLSNMAVEQPRWHQICDRVTY